MRLPLALVLALVLLPAPCLAGGSHHARNRQHERDARGQVRIGIERTIGAEIAWDLLPGLLAPSCSDPGWIDAAPPEREPRHRSAYPHVDRVEPRTCLSD